MLGDCIIHRARYFNTDSKTDYYPLDETLGLSRSKASKRLAKMVTQISAFMPFKETKKMIFDLAGIKISTTFIESITVQVGNKLFSDMQNKAQRPYSIKDKEKNVTTLYIGADGAMTPLIGDGCVEYKENKLGIVFNNNDIVQKKTKKGEIANRIEKKRLVSSLAEGVEPFKKLLNAAAIEKGYSAAKEVVFLSDGAAWLEKCKDEYFPKAVKILDWYHATEHLWTTAHKLFGEDNKEKCSSWVTPYEKMLWEGKVDDAILKLQSEIFTSKNNQQPLIELHGYFASNKNNMKYDYYRSKGWFIGSGFIESANKYIVTQRLKQSGMKWTHKAANAVIWVRCKYYEKEWDSFWEKASLSDILNNSPKMRIA